MRKTSYDLWQKKLGRRKKPLKVSCGSQRCDPQNCRENRARSGSKLRNQAAVRSRRRRRVGKANVTLLAGLSPEDGRREPSKCGIKVNPGARVFFGRPPKRWKDSWRSSSQEGG